MDAAGIERTVIFTGASTPERFAEAGQPYKKYPGRFDLWCGFDFTGSGQPGFGPGAVKALEECRRLGAVGVGEICDKGWGFRASSGGRGATGPAPAGTRPTTAGPHPNEPRMDALWDKCAQFGIPDISVYGINRKR